MTNQTSREKQPFFNGETYEQSMVIIMAIVALLIATIALLQTQVGTISARAKAEGQQYAMRALGTQTTGQIQTNYAWADAYREWVEWDSKAALSEDAAEQERYLALRGRAEQLTPLLTEPYFDPENDPRSDIKGFEADTYVTEMTYLTEKYLDAVRLGDLYGVKDDAYAAQDLLLAVTLFLFGLSLTVAGRVKWMFVGTGSMLAFISLSWMFLTRWPISTPKGPVWLTATIMRGRWPPLIKRRSFGMSTRTCIMTELTPTMRLATTSRPRQILKPPSSRDGAM